MTTVINKTKTLDEEVRSLTRVFSERELAVFTPAGEH
jgi:hypothetical protein